MFKRYSPDVLRLWTLQQDFTKEFKLSPQSLEHAVERYRKLRNTLRFCLQNLAEHSHALTRARAAVHRGRGLPVGPRIHGLSRGFLDGRVVALRDQVHVPVVEMTIGPHGWVPLDELGQQRHFWSTPKPGDTLTLSTPAGLPSIGGHTGDRVLNVFEPARH